MALLIFGRLIDQIGTRLGYAVSIVIWSIAAMCHALATGTIGQRNVFLVVHPDLARVARVRAVIDFLVETFARDAGAWAGTPAV